MVARSDLLTAELKTLRKGRGVSVAQIGDRVGPALRALCGATETTNAAELRQKLSDRLENLANELPDDLRVAAQVALGLYRDAQRPFYQERIRWLADHLQRDERTARRRADEALERLAEIAVAPGVAQNVDSATGSDEWYVAELRCAMVLDRAGPEAIEYRRITANRDHLTELDLSLSLPHELAAAEPAVEVIYGGTLRRRPDPARRTGFVLELPEPLRRYESTEFVLRYALPPAARLRPHYVVAALRRCDVFDLRVRFDRAHPPRQVWQVREAFGRDLDEGTARGDLIPLDDAGEIHLRFRNLRPALSYGAQWVPG